MNRFTTFLRQRKLPLVFGMVHLEALPGTPRNCLTVDEILRKAIKETELYVESGMDGVILENMGDVPYILPTSVTPDTVSIMTRCAHDMRRSVGEHCNKFLWGIQILAGCNKEALAVAFATDYDFVRCEGFIFAHVADEGTINACAGDLLRYRRSIGASHISVLTDVKKKHSAHAITADVNLVETAEAAEFFLSDGIIVTGTATGKPPEAKDVRDVKSAIKRIPVIVGSGITLNNVDNFLAADALIVGSYFKKDSNWSNEIDITRLKEFMDKISRLKLSK